MPLLVDARERGIGLIDRFNGQELDGFWLERWAIRNEHVGDALMLRACERHIHGRSRGPRSRVQR